MLSAQPLASLEASVTSAGEERELTLTVDGVVAPLVFGINVDATGDETLDPRAPRVLDTNGVEVVALASEDDLNGSTSGLLVVELAAGDYALRVGGENGTTGAFRADVFVSGDRDQSGNVVEGEMLWTTAALMQHYSFGNYITARVFARLGINFRTPLYDPNADADQDGDIDGFDYRQAVNNARSGSVTVGLIGDEDVPVLAIETTNDSGRFDDDGVTNNLGMTIDLTVTDASPINSIQASVDGNPFQEQLTEQQRNTQAQWQLSFDLAQLEALAGGASLENDGSHTLQVVATDEFGNTVDSPLEFTFEFDTVAPASPGIPDLSPGSDSANNTDDITNVTRPDIFVDPEDGALVELTSSISGSVGSGIANGTVTITAQLPDGGRLPDGVHAITATATDLAGNTSGASAPRSITIDTVAPVAPTVELDDTSDPESDGLTTTVTVSIVGQTEPGATVALNGTSISTIALGDGSYSLDNVDLAFGTNSYTVTATDAAGNSSQTTETFTRNDAPEFNDPGTLQVSENAVDGDVVGTVTTNDPNVGDPDNDDLTYTVVGGTGQDIFSVVEIDQETIEVRVADQTELDFESPNTESYTLEVEVIDSGGDGQGGQGLTDSITITIDVEDIPPAISADTYTVSENATEGQLVHRVPLDAGSDNDSVAFSITGGTGEDLFDINSATGNITVTALGATTLDHEAQASYTLEVTASDGSGADDSVQTFTIDVEDVAPVIAPDTFSVSENAAEDDLVVTVPLDPASDNDSVTLAITGGTGQNLFAIDGTTREITVTATGAATLDHEAQASYTLEVTATDSSGSDDSVQTITINVDDVAPAITADTYSVSENAAENDAVDTVPLDGASDTDSVTLSITGGTGENLFAIDGATGDITVTALGAETLDHEAQTSYTLEITASDGSGSDDSVQTFTIDVSDEAPAVDPGQQFSVSENAGNTTAVGTVEISGDDDSLSFSITGGNDDDIFGIDNSGQITVVNDALLDHEHDDSYVLTVQVTDGTTPSSQTVTIDVTDESPAIANQAMTVGEQALDGDEVGTVLNTGDTDTVTYSIAGGDPTGVFDIDNDGVITVATDGAAQLDDTGPAEFSLTIEVTDGTTGVVSATVTVDVLENVPPVATDDAYPNQQTADPPLLETDAELQGNVITDDTGDFPPNSEPGPDHDPDSFQNPITVTPATQATDADATGGGSYSLEEDGDFTFNPDGDFQDLPAGAERQATFDYEITDGLATDTATVTITVTGVNDNASISGTSTGAVTEDDVTTQASGTLAVTDPDTGEEVFQAVDAGDLAGTYGDFTFNETTGEWTYTINNAAPATHALNDGQEVHDQLTVTSIDGTDTQVIDITITGANDDASISGTATGALTENDVTDQVSDSLTITDPDSGEEVFQTPGSLVGTYGDFTFNATTGAWTYTLDNDRPATNALVAGQEVHDTLTVTSADGTDSQIIDITITGEDDSGLELVQPLPDVVIAQDGDPQHTAIDLTQHFSDGGPITFTAESDNEELVTVRVTGNNLLTTYEPYEAGQDRTPANITVTATSADGQMDDTFTFTVQPTITAEIELVIVADPTPEATARGTETLPTGITEVFVGDTYNLEIWMIDRMVGVSSRTEIINNQVETYDSVGLTGARVNVDFAQQFAQVIGVPDSSTASTNHAGWFNQVIDDPDADDPPLVDNVNGMVNAFNGGVVSTEGLGIAPEYVRLGYIEYEAIAGTNGTAIDFLLDVEQMSRQADVPSVLGLIDQSQIDIINVSIKHIETQQFDVQSSNLTVTGRIQDTNNVWHDFAPQASGANTPGMTGTITAVLDDLNNPTTIQLAGADLALTDTGSWEPAVNGASGNDIANLGLFAEDIIFVGNTLNFAGRELIATVSSDSPLAINGSNEFSSALQNWQWSSGSYDSRALAAAIPSADATGDVLDDNGSAISSLTGSNGNFQLTLPINRMLSFQLGSDSEYNVELFFTGDVTATFSDGADLMAAAGTNSIDPAEAGNVAEFAGDTPIEELFSTVVSTWTQALGLTDPVEIELAVADLANNQLGEAAILELNDSGVPVRGVVTIDEDANGLGWYSSLDGNVPADLFDLQTVFAHEVGHVLGFIPAHQGFASRVQVGPDGSPIFVGPDFTAELDANAHHLDSVAHPDDLMNSDLAPGRAQAISQLDVAIIKASYSAWQTGFVAESAAVALTASLPAVTENVAAITDGSALPLATSHGTDALIPPPHAATAQPAKTSTAAAATIAVDHALAAFDQDENWGQLLDEIAADKSDAAGFQSALDAIVAGWDSPIS